jgi:hypothetical protein
MILLRRGFLFLLAAWSVGPAGAAPASTHKAAAQPTTAEMAASAENAATPRAADPIEPGPARPFKKAAGGAGGYPVRSPAAKPPDFVAGGAAGRGHAAKRAARSESRPARSADRGHARDRQRLLDRDGPSRPRPLLPRRRRPRRRRPVIFPRPRRKALPARSPGTGSSPFPAPTARTPTFFISKAGSGASSGITRTGPARPTPIPARFSSTPFRKMTRCRKKSARNSEAAALPRNSTAREIIISRWRLPAAAGNSRSKISNDLRVERICNLTIPEVAIIINGIQAFR